MNSKSRYRIDEKGFIEWLAYTSIYLSKVNNSS